MIMTSQHKLAAGPGDHLRPDDLRALTFEAPTLTHRYESAREHVLGCAMCSELVSLERAENRLFALMEKESDREAFWAAVQEGAREDAATCPAVSGELTGSSEEEARPEPLSFSIWHELRELVVPDITRPKAPEATPKTAALRAIQHALVAVGLQATRTTRVQALGALLSPLPALLEPALKRALPREISDFMEKLPQLTVAIASRSTRSAEDIWRVLGPSPREIFVTHEMDGVSRCLEGLVGIDLLVVDSALPGFTEYAPPLNPACPLVVIGGSDEAVHRFEKGFGGLCRFVRSPFQAYDLLEAAAMLAPASVSSTR